jgi:plastocyanin
MQTLKKLVVGSILLLVVTGVSADQENTQTAVGAKIALIDDCDPADPRWAPLPGCLQDKGDVTRDEFDLLLFSPLSSATVGHPSWRNDPSYLVVQAGKEIHLENQGGRPHTFTEVAEFGGGRIPPLNRGLAVAPACVLAPGATDPTELAAGERKKLTATGTGIHRFQCCFHPWMRAAVKVTEAPAGGQD